MASSAILLSIRSQFVRNASLRGHPYFTFSTTNISSIASLRTKSPSLSPLHITRRFEHTAAYSKKTGDFGFEIDSFSSSTPTNYVEDYDVCIIGCGPGGFAAAMRAWDYGKSVCVIEKSRLGGAGIHNGALSSKTMWELSEDFKRSSKTNRGYESHVTLPDYRDIALCISQAQAIKEAQIQQQLNKLKIPVFRGRAQFLSTQEVAIESESRQICNKIRAKNFVIATGSRPRLHDTILTDREIIMNSDDVINLSSWPKSLVILGAGVIGCEYATIFANFKQTKVYVIDKADRILPFEDEDVSKAISDIMIAKGITVHHGAKLLSMEVVNGQVEYEFECPKNKTKDRIRVEKALLSIGRVPNLEGLGLERVGVKMVDKHKIYCKDVNSSVDNIWVIGDTTMDLALVNVAEIEGRHCIDKMFGGKKADMSYENISTIMFVDPEVAAVGANEQTLQRKKIPYKVATYSYALVSRAIAMGATEGFVKLLVSNDDDMKVLGIRALGQHSSSVIDIVSLMVRLGKSIHEIEDLITGYPAVTEGLLECVRMLNNTSIMKPHAFNKNLLRVESVSYNQEGHPVFEEPFENEKGNKTSKPNRIHGL